LVIGLENLKLDFSTKEIDLIFKALDENKDGYIDFPEFSNISEGNREKVLTPIQDRK